MRFLKERIPGSRSRKNSLRAIGSFSSSKRGDGSSEIGETGPE